MTTPEQIPFLRLDRQFAEHRDAFMAAMLPVFESGAVLQGPPVAAFENALAKTLSANHAVAVGSGTDAMILSLMALGLPEGSRVAVPALTFVASASAILHNRCVPVFVDCDPHTGLAREGILLDLIARRSVDAIIVVHLYGQLQDLDAVGPAAKAAGIVIVEDAAQAIGATRHGVPVGRAGAITAISFDPMKVIGAFGSGGAVITNDAELAARVRQLRYHGHDGKGNYLRPGFNCQMHSLQAALLAVKLGQMQAWQTRRTVIAAIFDEHLRQVPGARRLATLSGNIHNHHKYVLWIDRREELRTALAGKGIQTKVHYEVPLHRQPLFAAWAASPACPEAEAAAAHVLSLPMYPELTDDEARRIALAARTALETLA